MVQTEFGIPEKVQRPFVCVIEPISMTIFWFTPNPKTFGAASDYFEVNAKGNGKVYEEMPMLKMDMAEALAYGDRIVAAMTTRLGKETGDGHLYVDYIYNHKHNHNHNYNHNHNHIYIYIYPHPLTLILILILTLILTLTLILILILTLTLMLLS